MQHFILDLRGKPKSLEDSCDAWQFFNCYFLIVVAIVVIVFVATKALGAATAAALKTTLMTNFWQSNSKKYFIAYISGMFL